MGHTWAEMNPDGAQRQANAWVVEQETQARGFTSVLKATVVGLKFTSGDEYHADVRGCKACGQMIFDVDLHLKHCQGRNE